MHPGMLARPPEVSAPSRGFVFKGSMWRRYGDQEKVIHAGEAFYARPGHTAGATADSEFLFFSPSEAMAQELQSASRC
jgi:hypothetical protein